MYDTATNPGWAILPPTTIKPENRLEHVRYCSHFAAAILDRFPEYLECLDAVEKPDRNRLESIISELGLDAGLRRYRNRIMLHIIWRDLCGLATLEETFSHLTSLAEICLQTSIAHHSLTFVEKYGTPRDEKGEECRLYVIALGKFGGGELNLSSDIDIMFGMNENGECDGHRRLSNDQFFTRMARAVITSLSDVTDEGFCFRVDTRLRPYGDSGPLVASSAAMEQYYQREGRDWERYALIKARIVAGDPAAGQRLLNDLKPFVYRRYIDYGSIEALREMHSNVQDDARRKDRLDDIKRGPGGIREIEFLAQCFQILRGGREPALQTPSLDTALEQIASLELMKPESVLQVRHDYAFLRFLENRIQAFRDQQTHRVPDGADRERIARAMYEESIEALQVSLDKTRTRVSERFHGIFPEQPETVAEKDDPWAERWRQLQGGRQDPEQQTSEDPLQRFMRRIDRMSMSGRARRRLDQFMPGLLERIDRMALDNSSLNRVIDLVLGISRRSAYLVLLVQQPRALDRMLELFSVSDWIADKVIRFPALLDELIDPALGQQIPGAAQLSGSVARILETAQSPEIALDALNYLKLSTELRLAVAQLKGNLGAESCQGVLSDLAACLVSGVLTIASDELKSRHGKLTADGEPELGVIAYGTLGAREMGYSSDLDIVFLFLPSTQESDGKRALPAERYYARLAQRVLSLLNVLTASGKLYETDTRLRPNGRAGSLVSNVKAFREYQLGEAWTWELQALTRAQFIAGHHELEVQFNRVRQEVLCQLRDPDELQQALVEMRARMSRSSSGPAKYCPGGLIDIEFIAQFGLLSLAATYPRLIQATGTVEQLRNLAAVRWLDASDCDALVSVALSLRQQRLLLSLDASAAPPAVDTTVSEAIFNKFLGTPVNQE